MLFEIDICDPDTREVVWSVERRQGGPLRVFATGHREALLRFARSLGYSSENPFPWLLRARQVA